MATAITGNCGEHRGEPALVLLRLPGAEPGGRHRLLVVAGGRPPGLPEPAGRRVRRWPWPAGSNLLLSAEIFASFGAERVPRRRRPLQDVRRRGRRLRPRRGRGRRRPEAAVRALADGDPIYAVIRGGAVNQDGRTNGLTAPSRQAQEAVLRAGLPARRRRARAGRVRRGARHRHAARRPDRGSTRSARSSAEGRPTRHGPASSAR